MDPSIHFKRHKSPPLTPDLIYALLIAIQKQERKIPFLPTGIKGSLTLLITRGLIVKRKIIYGGHREFQWKVTKQAITKLKNLGIHV